MTNVEKIKSRVAQLMNIETSDITKVIEIDGDAVVYLNDNTKYAFSDDKLVKIEKPEAKPEKVISEETERDFSDNSFEEEEEKSMEDLEAELLAEITEGEMSNEIFEEIEEVDWDDVEAALEALNKKEKLEAAKKARKKVENARLQREREEAETNAQYVDPTYNPDTGNTIAEDVNKEKQAEINAKLEAERIAESQKQFDEAMQAEKDRIEAEKAAYADDIEKYGYKVGRTDAPTEIDTSVTPNVPVPETEEQSVKNTKTADPIVVPIVPEEQFTSTEYKPFETTHHKVEEPESESPAIPIDSKTESTKTEDIVPPVVVIPTVEPVTTPANTQENVARVVENTYNPTKTEEPIIAPVVPQPETFVPVVDGPTPYTAIPQTENKQTEAPKYAGETHQVEVPVGPAPVKEEPAYKHEDTVTHVPLSGETEPVFVQPKAQEQVKLTEETKTSHADAQKTPIVDATQNKEVEAATGAVIIGGMVENVPKVQGAEVHKFEQSNIDTPKHEPVTGTQNHETLKPPVVETPKVADTPIVDTQELPKFEQPKVVTPEQSYVAPVVGEMSKQTITEVPKSEYKPTEEHNADIGFKPEPIKTNQSKVADVQTEVNMPPMNVLNATFDGTHYVAPDGKKFTREEVLITPTGAIIENRDNKYKLDDKGNVVYNVSGSQSSAEYNTTAKDSQGYDPLKATFGKTETKFNAEEAAHYTVAGVPYLIATKATKENISNIDSAHAVIKQLNSEHSVLKSEIGTAKKELEVLKNTGGNTEKIKSLEETIKVKSEKLTEVQANQTRVNDFIKNGANEKYVMTKDSLGSTKYSKEHTQELRKAMQEGKKGQSPIDDGLGKGKIGAKTGDAISGTKGQTIISTGKTQKENMQTVHNNRMEQFFGKHGKKFAVGAGRAFKNVMRESDELDMEVEMYDDVMMAKNVIMDSMGAKLLQAELIRLGLDKGALAKELSKMGSITGVGDVSKLSLEELQAILGNSKIKLTMDAKRDLVKAIDIKKKLSLSNTDLAGHALSEAGEYLKYSKKRLESMLKSTTDEKVRTQIELAIKYKGLNKYQKAALNKWQSIRALAQEIARKLLGNDENMSRLLGLSDNAMTAYRTTKTVVSLVQKANAASAAKTGATVGQKLAKESLSFSRKAANTKAIQTAGGQVIQTAGKKGVQTAVTGTAKGKAGQFFASSIAKAKGALGIGGASAGAGAASAGAGATAGGAAGAAGGAAGGAGGAAVGVVAGIVLLIILAFVIIVCMIGSIFSFVMGDDKAQTSVPEMVEYIQEKNTNLLAEIEAKANGNASIKDAQGNTIEYSKVTYTYYDADGNWCMITDNTKELISMAAVYFEQDFSDTDAIYDWLDEMWEKTHTVTYTESELYGCGGNICLNEDNTFNTTAQGFNADYRNYYCYENYLNIPYDDCFELETEKLIRVNTDKDSYRLPTSVYYGSEYTGIDMRTISEDEISKMGYGCLTKTETFNCEDIASITNTEVLAKLVRATDISYNTLLSQKYCKTKIEHSGTYEGKPASGCSIDECSVEKRYKLLSYKTLPEECPDDNGYHVFKWNSSKSRYEHTCSGTGTLYYFNNYDDANGDGRYVNYDTIYVWWSAYYEMHSFWIPYYTCKKSVGYCNGHSIQYHYCDGTHQEAVCYGHVDLTVNIEVIGFDELFEIEIDKPQKQWKHKTTGEIINDSKYSNMTNDEKANYERYREPYIWTDDYIEWCKNLYNQNWKELYGIYVPTSLYEYIDGVGTAILPTNPSSLPIPLLNQLDFPNTPYSGVNGSSNVADSGCGLVCVAMLEMYYNEDNAKTVPNLATMLGNYYYEGQGSAWALFEGSASKLNHPFECQTASWEQVVQALQDGKPVVSIQNSDGPFTSGGHYILLTGITPDGKILVNDPNGANYNKAALIDGFANGFNQAMIKIGSSGAYWIYGAKEEPVETPET